MPGINYLPYRRQFYIGAQPKIIDATWQMLALRSGLHLSYSKDLPVQVIISDGGAEFVLLGDAVQSLPGAPSVLKCLKSLLNKESLQQTYASWAGRWVLLADGEVHLDASGLLGCYYKKEGVGVQVASTPAFIANTDKPDTFRLLKAGGAEFYPPPSSGFKDIDKLLPSQILNLHTGAIQFRNLQTATPALNYTESIAYLASLLTTALKNVYAECNGKKLLLALTGGFDSRTLMAALNYSKLPYDTFTFHGPNMRPSDVSIPKKLAQIAGKKHRLIKRQIKKVENWAIFNQHTCEQSVENDRYIMMYQQFDLIENNNIILRGGGFEVGRCAYYPWLPADQLDGAGISAIQKGNALQGVAWNRWLHWVNKTPQIKMDWRDRYYIEQRLAGWLSCTEQALDIVNIDRMIPANSTLFFNVMRNIPEHIRKTKVQMIDLIKYLSPELLQMPVNPPVNFYYKQYRRVLFKLSKLKQKLIWE